MAECVTGEGFLKGTWLVMVLQICVGEPAQHLLFPAPVLPRAVDCTAAVLLQGGWVGLPVPPWALPCHEGRGDEEKPSCGIY